MHEASTPNGIILLLKCDKEGDPTLFSSILDHLITLYQLNVKPKTFVQPPFDQTWCFIYTTSHKVIPFNLMQFYQKLGIIPTLKLSKFEPAM